jgi:hypothetical protein
MSQGLKFVDSVENLGNELRILLLSPMTIISVAGLSGPLYIRLTSSTVLSLVLYSV